MSWKIPECRPFSYQYVLKSDKLEGVFQSLEKSWDFSPTIEWIFLFKILNKQCGVQEYPLIEYILETSVTLTANLYSYYVYKKVKEEFLKNLMLFKCIINFIFYDNN